MSDRCGPGAAWRRDRIGSARAGTNPTVLARLPESCAVMGGAQSQPGDSGLLGFQSFPGLRSVTMIQYWESVEKLQAFANDAQRTHCPATACCSSTTRPSTG